MAKTKDAVPTCSGCACELGDAAKVLPVFDAGLAHCPPCFVGKVSAHQPGRWELAAVRCQFCQFVTLAPAGGKAMAGTLSCSRCGKPAAKRLPPNE